MQDTPTISPPIAIQYLEEESQEQAQKPRIKRRRYRRTLRFFGGVVVSLIGWEIVLPRIIGRRAVRRGRPARLERYARNFRSLAVEMGGVMIKLGQFFSTRVDILPVEITRELAGLQDEVPATPFEEVRPLIEADLGPLDETFARFNSEAHAAASLGQVYRARLHNEERVAVKVRRPGIETLVATDLAALEVVGGWAMRYKPIRRRANVPALLDEFARTLWEELDYEAEASNAERIGAMFEDDLGVYVPAVYREYSTGRVLTLEDVTSIKITDHDRMDDAGVDRREAAMRLFDLYMIQIFEHRFFHADPHPGNLFVYPLPLDSNGARPDAAPKNRPFYLVFVDFGMVGRITDNVLAGLREGMLAIGTRDMRRLVNAYQILGVLLPNADLDRLAEAEQKMFDRMWGMSMQEIRGLHSDEMREFVREFGDLLYEMPFQVPQDLIYLGRAMGILSGMCTSLDTDFNLWSAVTPYAQRLVEEELRLNRGTLLQEARKLGQLALSLPRLADNLFRRAEQGELQVRTNPDREAQRQQRRLEKAINRLATGVVFASLVVAGTVLVVNDLRVLGLAGYALAGASLVVSLWRGIRQNMA
jgi:predicted unusual protein kinase regulating ubiquinone biosynthesis (AarF/ABC1/UbiB family)